MDQTELNNNNNTSKIKTFLSMQLYKPKISSISQAIDVNSQVTMSAILSAQDMLKETNKSVKTPISLLQEILTKCNMALPNYEEVATEGFSHEPTFVYRVVVADIVASANGSSKKRAKQAVAYEVLNQLKKKSLDSNNQPLAVKIDSIMKSLSQISVDENKLSDSGNAEESENPIGHLIELAQRHSMRPPEFVFGEEEGPSHDRQFQCEAIFGDLKQKAFGKSKKQAKRLAALKLLHTIKNENHDQKIFTDEKAINNELPYSFKTFSKELQLNGNKKSIDFIQQCRSSVKPMIQNLMNIKNLKELNNFRPLLDKISQEENFEYRFFTIKKNEDDHLTFLQLYTWPVLCLLGRGKNYEEAIEDASKNALEAIQIYSQKS